jgi:hypothetical protein
MRQIVTRCAGNGHNLGKRVTTGFTRFGLDCIEDGSAAGQDQIVKAADNPRPV